MAALARHSLATRDTALTRRREQTDLLTTLVGDQPHPRELRQRLAATGVVNATGTFVLRAAHTHPVRQTHWTRRYARAAQH